MQAFRFFDRVVLAVSLAGLAAGTVVTSACATAENVASSSRRDVHDRAYLSIRFKDEGCLPQLRRQCCPLLKERMDQALARGDMATVATALDALAIACPDQRSDAIAALDRRFQAEGGPDAGSVHVIYSARIGPSDRIYWISAFVDGKQLAGTALPPGSHALEVEVHVMTASGADSDALFRIKAHKELVIEPRASRTFVASLIRKPSGGPDPFALALTEPPAGPAEAPAGETVFQPAAAAQPGGVAAAVPSARQPGGPGVAGPVPRGAHAAGTAQRGPQPGHEDQPAPPMLPGPATAGRLKSLPRPRLPSELNRGQTWHTFLKVCVGADGRVDSLVPIAEQPHPRLLGVLADALVHAEYHPYTVSGRPVPFCYPLRITVGPPPG